MVIESSKVHACMNVITVPCAKNITKYSISILVETQKLGENDLST